MKLDELREKHPRLIYRSYSIQPQDTTLDIAFDFLLEPDIVFRPTATLPLREPLDLETIENFVFHLGLVELISYWKAACPPEIAILPGQLSTEQLAWWHDLFIHGLGEFFFQNKLDFTPANFLTLKPAKIEPTVPTKTLLKDTGNLILVGGGKDSVVTLEVLKQSSRRKGTFVLNPIRAALDSIRIAGYDPPLTVRRTIDPTLIALNKAGYLNGHTPFSAYLAFLGVLVGALHGYDNIIASNESSANEQNTIFHQLKINHQYSKSFRFEQRFRDYCQQYLTEEVKYFSFLRPLFDFQISGIFANCTDQHLSFRSCNVHQKKDSWCKQCPKCAFVYLMLFPFLSYEQMLNIFDEDLYWKPEIESHLKGLTGIGAHKPFECVGTIEESQAAISLSIEKYKAMGKLVPPILSWVAEKTGFDGQLEAKALVSQVMEQWGEENFLSLEQCNLLKQALASVKV